MFGFGKSHGREYKPSFQGKYKNEGGYATTEDKKTAEADAVHRVYEEEAIKNKQESFTVMNATLDAETNYDKSNSRALDLIYKASSLYEKKIQESGRWVNRLKKLVGRFEDKATHYSAKKAHLDRLAAHVINEELTPANAIQIMRTMHEDIILEDNDLRTELKAERTHDSRDAELLREARVIETALGEVNEVEFFGEADAFNKREAASAVVEPAPQPALVTEKVPLKTSDTISWAERENEELLRMQEKSQQNNAADNGNKLKVVDNHEPIPEANVVPGEAYTATVENKAKIALFFVVFPQDTKKYGAILNAMRNGQQNVSIERARGSSGVVVSTTDETSRVFVPLSELTTTLTGPILTPRELGTLKMSAFSSADIEAANNASVQEAA